MDTCTTVCVAYACVFMDADVLLDIAIVGCLCACVHINLHVCQHCGQPCVHARSNPHECAPRSTSTCTCLFVHTCKLAQTHKFMTAFVHMHTYTCVHIRTPTYTRIQQHLSLPCATEYSSAIRDNIGIGGLMQNYGARCRSMQYHRMASYTA